jgi:hypothetical protein
MAMIMPHAKAPCQDCSDRTVGCHGTCEKYAKYRKDRNKLRRELKKKAKEDYTARSYMVDAVYRVQHNEKMKR